jgi:glycosyltransferase 2 family protein
MALLRAGLLVVGVVFLGILVATNDPAAIFASITQLSWRLAVIACFPFVLVTTFDTLGWHFAFLRPRVDFPTLLAVRLAGEAFNLTTPTASLGGEAVKAWMLRRRVPLDEGVASVVVAKTTIMMGQGLFLLVGIGVTWIAAPWESRLLAWMVWLLALEVLAIVGFLFAQIRGGFAWVPRVLARIGLGRARHGETVARLDRGLAWFYRKEPRRLALSIFFHFVAWLLGSLEAYLILYLLGIEVSLATATIIEALGTAVRFATFLVPASLGALEGGYVATFTALGLSSSAGVAFGLARRVREILWIAVGFVVFALVRSRSADGVGGPVEAPQPD